MKKNNASDNTNLDLGTPKQSARTRGSISSNSTYLSTIDAATVLGITDTRLRQLYEGGEVPGEKQPGYKVRVRFKRSDILAFKMKRETRPPQPFTIL